MRDCLTDCSEICKPLPGMNALFLCSGSWQKYERRQPASGFTAWTTGLHIQQDRSHRWGNNCLCHLQRFLWVLLPGNTSHTVDNAGHEFPCNYTSSDSSRNCLSVWKTSCLNFGPVDLTTVHQHREKAQTQQFLGKIHPHFLAPFVLFRKFLKFGQNATK